MAPPCGSATYRVLILISKGYPRAQGRLDTRDSPIRRSPASKASFRSAAPRLACVRPVASVHPEPGSNSPLYIQCLASGLICPDLSPRQDASCIYWLAQFTCSHPLNKAAEIDGFLCLVKLPAYCPSGLSAGCLTVLPLCLCNPFKELFLQRSRQCFSESECKGRGFWVNHQTLQEKNWRKT